MRFSINERAPNPPAPSLLKAGTSLRKGEFRCCASSFKKGRIGREPLAPTVGGLRANGRESIFVIMIAIGGELSVELARLSATPIYHL